MKGRKSNPVSVNVAAHLARLSNSIQPPHLFAAKLRTQLERDAHGYKMHNGKCAAGKKRPVGLMFTVSKRLHDKLQATAARLGMEQSDIGRIAIRHMLEELEKVEVQPVPKPEPEDDKVSDDVLNTLVAMVAERLTRAKAHGDHAK